MLSVTSMLLSVTNVLEAISYSAVVMISRFWRSMMDCGNDGGRVPRPVLPKARNQIGGGNSLSGRASMPRLATTKV
jgi:hypothetical protein